MHDLRDSAASAVAQQGSASGVTANGSQVTVNLTGVTNAQTIGLTLAGVNNGQTTVDCYLPVSFLASDSNGDGSVNSGDAIQTRARSGQTTNSTNFRSDFNLDGSINASDATFVKTRSGRGLTSAQPE